MEKTSKIYIAGHRGLVGSAIKRALEKAGYTQLIYRTHRELDLEDPLAVRYFFEQEQPEYVFLAAAYVGGIRANNEYRADFLARNLAIQQNVLLESHRSGVKKLLFLGSTCIYPKDCPQPIREEYLLTSPLEYTNEPYAIAKIAGLKMCESLNLQYGTDFIAVMPTNLYGKGDNFDLYDSHVLPALVRKLHLANLLDQGDWEAIRTDLSRLPYRGLELDRLEDVDYLKEALRALGLEPGKVHLWGTGKPRREFLCSDDLASACLLLMERVSFRDLLGGEGEVRNSHLNVGTGKDISIGELAQLVAETIGYSGELLFDLNQLDGTLVKCTDPSRMMALGWQPQVSLREGVAALYRDYLERS